MNISFHSNIQKGISNPLQFLIDLLQEHLSTLETRISRMEHQAAQHQQYVSIEGIDNSNVVVVKGINVLLTLLQVPIILYQYQYHIFSFFPGCVNTSCHCRSDSETFSADAHPCRNHGKHQKYF